MTDSKTTTDQNSTKAGDNGSIWDIIKMALFLGLIYILYVTFNSDPGEERFNKLVEMQGASDQKRFLKIVGDAVTKAKDTDNDAAATTAYINGNKLLCTSPDFDPSGVKSGWVGVFDQADITDSNSKMYVEIEIGFNNSIRSEVPAKYRDFVLGLEEGQPVLFDGQFRPGNMAENQCFRTTWSLVMGSSPELTRREFSFDLSKIAPAQNLEN